jgi:hypothetical protein
MWAPWWEKWRHFAWPVKVLKSGMEFFRILSIHIFKVPLLSTIKGQSKCLQFFLSEYFFVCIRQAGDYYPFAGTPSLESKHETYTHTEILTAIQPPIGPLEVISGSKQT